MAPAKKPTASKGGAPKEKKPAYVYSKAYEVSGDSLTRTKKSCPKCGDGVWMADHKDRNTCGKCLYMEKK